MGLDIKFSGSSTEFKPAVSFFESSLGELFILIIKILQRYFAFALPIFLLEDNWISLRPCFNKGAETRPHRNWDRNRSSWGHTYTTVLRNQITSRSSAGQFSPACPLAAICLVKFSGRKTPLWIWASAKLASQFKHRNTLNTPSVAALSLHLLIQLGWMTHRRCLDWRDF